MTTRMESGWLTVDIADPGNAAVQVAVGDVWYPAFVDYADGKRVARVRIPDGTRGPVSVLIDGHTVNAGRIKG